MWWSQYSILNQESSIISINVVPILHLIDRLVEQFFFKRSIIKLLRFYRCNFCFKKKEIIISETFYKYIISDPTDLHQLPICNDFILVTDANVIYKNYSTGLWFLIIIYAARFIRRLISQTTTFVLKNTTKYLRNILELLLRHVARLHAIFQILKGTFLKPNGNKVRSALRQKWY